jgi:hypothetical protein
VTSSRSSRTFLIAAGLMALALCAGALWPALARPSNCGGNSAALAACQGYVTVLRLWAVDREDQKFRFDQADDEARQYLAQLPGASWISSARLLAMDDVLVDQLSSEKKIIMVCDRAYDNVPQRIGRSPMAHAVAYSTGETGLISPEEFARLDLTGFTDLHVLTTKKNVELHGVTNASQAIHTETNRTSPAAGSRR